MKRKLHIFIILLFLIVNVGYGIFIYQDIFAVKDIPPEIYFDSNLITVSVKDDDLALLAGVSAMDEQDGDVTGSLIVEEKTRFVSDATRSVSYVAFDKNHNACRATRKMVYSDYKNPEITLIAPLIFTSSETNFNPENCVKASSVLDGDITNKVRILNSKDYIVGDNQIELSVSDSAGGEQSIKVTCTINPVYHPDKLSIELTDYLITAEVGSTIEPKDYIQDVLLRGQEATYLIDDVTYNQVSLTNTGVYEINYHLANGEDEAFSRLVILVV